MYKAAVIGDYDSIYGFAALGLDTFPTTDDENLVKLFRRVMAGEYAIVYVTEQLAEVLADEIEKYKEQLMPAVILIPGVKGNTGMGVQGIRDCVEQAIGSDILFGNK